MPSTIVDIHGRQILDSRGNPTVEVDVRLADGSFGRAAVPSGASTGVHEAWELRDGRGQAIRRQGCGAGRRERQREAGRRIARHRRARSDAARSPHDRTGRQREQEEPGRQRHPGRFAGGGPRRGRASPACRCFDTWAASAHGVLPAPMMNIINGGAHADNAVDVQEFMVMPLGFDCFSDALRCGVEVFHSLKKVLQSKGFKTAVGDEGGFAPDLRSNTEALELIVEAVGKAGLRDRSAGLHRLGRRRHRAFRRQDQDVQHGRRKLDSAGMVDFLAGWVDKYPICSIEDGCAEDDWDGWKLMTERLGDKIATGRRRSVRHQHQASGTRHPRAHRQQHPYQGQPDRHAHRDDRGHRDGPPQRLYRAFPAIAAARPKTRRSRTWPWPCGRARSKPARSRAPIAWPSTMNCCGSKRRSATRRSTADRCSPNAERAKRGRSSFCRGHW